MTSHRIYKFDLKQAVTIPRGKKGTIIDRQPDPDQPQTVQCLPTEKGAVRGGDGAFYKTISHPVNAYRVEYLADGGRVTSDWWHENMLSEVPA